MAPAFTFNLNLPSKSVTVPFDVPFSFTVAPMTGPISSSTVPVISVWPYIAVPTRMSVMLNRNLLSLSICFTFLVHNNEI